MSQLEDILDDALADFDIGPPKGPDQDQKTKEKLPDFNAFIQVILVSKRFWLYYFDNIQSLYFFSTFENRKHLGIII